jgi:hypothetical protein
VICVQEQSTHAQPLLQQFITGLIAIFTISYHWKPGIATMNPYLMCSAGNRFHLEQRMFTVTVQ